MSDANGTVLAHSLDAEKVLIGTVLTNRRALDIVRGLVGATDFFHPGHQAAWEAIEAIDAAGEPIESWTVWERMQAADTSQRLRAAGGDIYLAGLLDCATVTSDEGPLEWHAKHVRNLAVLRRLTETVTAVRAACFTPGAHADEIREQLESAALDAARSMAEDTAQPFKAALRAAHAAAEARYNSREAPKRGARTGWNGLDVVTGGGWVPGRLTVVAARPGMGKTAWALATAIRGANAGVPVFVASLEMDAQSLAERYLAAIGGIDADRIASGRLIGSDFTRMMRATSDGVDLPIVIDDRVSQTMAQIGGAVRRWRYRTAPVEKHPIAICVVDYLQIVAPRDRKTPREQQVAEIATSLKQLARAVPGLHVIALAQLNREAEKRGDKRPTLADLRESGQIEQDADMVGFIYRPHVYTDTADPTLAELIIAKNRHGALTTIPMQWTAALTRFATEE